MMQCKPHARTQRTPVVVALPCAPAAHCREAAAVVEPSARPRHPRGEDDEMRKLGVFRPPGHSVAELQPRSWVYLAATLGKVARFTYQACHGLNI
jgi:hypothetical protein